MKQDKENQSQELVTEEVDSEYEDWQYEMSTDMAINFVDENIMPLVNEYDWENKDEDYIPGITSYILFTKMVESLIEQGFTPDEMNKIIREVADLTGERIVH